MKKGCHMLYISELLPNPGGKDTDGEWIELCTAGAEEQSLAGWKLQNVKGKTFSLPDHTLEPYQCTAFDYAQTKLTLTNTGGTFYLLDPAGEIADIAVYEGTYKDDMSAMRTGPISAFVMSSTPTKGLPNKLTAPEAQSKKSAGTEYRATVADTAGQQKVTRVIQGSGSYGDAILGGIGAAAVLTSIFWFAFKMLYTKPNEQGDPHSNAHSNRTSFNSNDR